MKKNKKGQKIDAIKKEIKPKVQLNVKKQEREVTISDNSAQENTPQIKKRRHVRGIWAVTIILVLCVIFGTVVWYFILSNPEGGLTPILYNKQAEEDKNKEDEKEGLKTYSNLSALFAFDYPEAWVLEEKNNSIILSSDTIYPSSYFNGENPVMKDTEIYIQIHFSNQEVDISREAPALIRPKKTAAKIGDVEVTKTTYRNDDIFAEIISNFQVGDFIFTIICDTKSKNTDKIEAYNQMLASFLFGEDVIKDTKK